MSELYAVEVPGIPNKNDYETRFATFPGNEYSGIGSLKMVKLGKVIYRDKRGVLVCAKSFDLNCRIVDDLHEAVKNGHPQQFLATARVVKYISATNSFEVAYSGRVEKRAAIEPEIPKAFLAHDGTWRKPPSFGFSKGAREWGLGVAHVDRGSNVAYADRFNGTTKLETLQKLFESPVPWVQDYVLTLPFADPQDIPVPPEPAVEYVPTQAEIDAAPALSHEEFDKLPAAVINEQFVLDPIFRARVRKMEAEDARKLVIFNQQKEEEDFRKAADALRKKKAVDAENEAFKTGRR
jgi:hypothetical protein